MNVRVDSVINDNLGKNTNLERAAEIEKLECKKEPLIQVDVHSQNSSYNIEV